MVTKLKNLYILLNIKRKLPDEYARCFYLHYVWGMKQEDVAACENVSQPVVSRLIKIGSLMTTINDMRDYMYQNTTTDEIQYLQKLPRDILSDVQLIAFVTDLIGIKPLHSLYTSFDHKEPLRIAALASLGVQNKRLQQIYNKSQAGISMIVKRQTEKALSVERFNRYDFIGDFAFKPRVESTTTFTLAGGNDFEY